MSLLNLYNEVMSISKEIILLYLLPIIFDFKKCINVQNLKQTFRDVKVKRKKYAKKAAT